MKIGLLWVSHARDLPWFEVSAKSFGKLASGWDDPLCLVPRQDEPLFLPVCKANNIRLVGADQWEDKPFNWHQSRKCMADQYLQDSDVIFHLDSDTVFALPCTPADWMPGGKLLQPFTEYKHFLSGPVPLDAMRTFMGFTGLTLDMNRNQYMWKFAVDYALGWSEEREFMPWMPMLHYRHVYHKTRQLIAERFPDQGFEGYVRGCRDTWPQSFCEFNTLGAVAYRFFHDKYQWYDLAGRPYPFLGKIIQSWGAGGLDREHDYGLQVQTNGINTPRKLFQHLGLM